MKKSPRYAVAILAGSLAFALSSHGQDDAEEVFTLSPFEVTSGDESGYRVNNVVSAGLIEQQIYDIPIPIQVLDDQLISDFNVDDFLSILQYTPGVQQTSTGTIGADFRVRGFNSRPLRNGFFVFNPPVLANVERVEVAKGPSSVLYGLGATGGVVNRISKTPKFVPEGSIYVGVGNYDYFRSLLDVTGPIAESDKFAFRLIADHVTHESDIDFEEIEKSSITPSLRIVPTENIILNFEYEEQYIRNIPELGARTITDAATGGRHDKTKADLGGTDYTFSDLGPQSWRDIDTETLTAEGTFILSDWVTFNAAYFDTKLRSDEGRLLFARAASGARFEIDNRIIDNEAYRANFLFNWGLGEDVQVKSVLGYDFREELPTRITRRRRASSDGLVFDPATLTLPQSEIDAVREVSPFRNNPRRITAEGIRLTNTITALDGKLHGILGVRSDESETEALASGAITEGDDVTYQAGVIYELREGVSVFANTSTSYTPNGSLDRDGNTLDPETGKGFDIGFKFQTEDGKFAGEITYFDQTREDVAVRINISDDPVTPDIDESASFFELSGKEQSQGFEFVFSHNATENLQLVFSGSLYDPEVVSDDNDPRRVGLEPEDQVSSSLNFMANYSLNDWILGMSVNWRDDAPAQSRYDRRNVRTDDYYLVNLFAKYKFQLMERDAEFSLNIDNALDKRGYIPVQSNFGQPLQAKAGLKLFF